MKGEGGANCLHGRFEEPASRHTYVLAGVYLTGLGRSVKSAFEPSAHQAGAYHGFLSMK